jgi:hypothetical protein
MLFTVIVLRQEECRLERSSPSPPVFVAPPPDPALAILQKQTENANIEAMKSQATQDTAHLMQQYGIMNALTGFAAPLPASPASTVPISGMSLVPGVNTLKSA